MDNTAGDAGRSARGRPLLLLGIVIAITMSLAGGATGEGGPPPAKAPPEKPLFTLAHLSDLHCVTTKANRGKRPERKLRYVFGAKVEHWKDLVNSFDVLAGTVDYLNEEIKPDLVVITGDLTDRGRPLSDMKRVKSVLDGLECPYHPVMGDHDLGKSVAAFEKDRNDNSWVKVFGRRCTSFDIKGWHFSVVGIYPGDEEIRWLEKDLDANATKPTVICTHRLVYCPDIIRRSAKRSVNVELLMPRAEEVMKIIAARPSVVLVLSGHCHVNLQLRAPGMETAFLTTEALGEIPHEFRIIRFFADRAEMEFRVGGTIEKIRKGLWTKKENIGADLLTRPLTALAKANLEKAEALLESARKLEKAGKRRQAMDACRRLIRTFPGTEPAAAAAKRLARLLSGS
ncbi:MAG: metallophosphoesterase [Planctomycetota bacterium]